MIHAGKQVFACIKKTYKLSALVIVCLFLGMKSGYTQPQSDSPIIIVMYSDDHTAQSIGAYRDALGQRLCN